MYKKTKRYVALILCVAMLLSMFINVSAANETTYVATNPLIMSGEIRVGGVGGGANISKKYTQTFNSNGVSGDVAYTTGTSTNALSSEHNATFKISTHNGTLLFKSGDKVKLSIDGLLVYYGTVPIAGSRYAYLVKANQFWCNVHFSDGTSKAIQLNSNDLKLNCPSGSYPYLYFENSFTATADIAALEYYIFFDKDCFNVAYNSSQCIKIGSYLTDCDMTYTIISDDTVEIRDGVLGIIDRLKLTYDKVVSGFSSVVSAISNSVSNGASAIWEKFSSILTSMSNSLSGLANGIWSKFSSILTTISTSTSNMATNVGNVINTAFSSVGDKVVSAVNGIKNTPAQLWNTFNDGLQTLFVPSDDVITSQVSNLRDKFPLVDSVVDFAYLVNEKFNYKSETFEPVLTVDIPKNEKSFYLRGEHSRF